MVVVGRFDKSLSNNHKQLTHIYTFTLTYAMI